MLDFGWQEFLVVAVVTVLVVGPKELPRVFRTITGFMRKARSLAGEFHSAMDEMAKEADLQDIKKQVEGVKNGSSSWVKEIDPTGEVEKSVRDMKTEVNAARGEVNKAGRSDPAASPSTTTPKPDVKASDEKAMEAAPAKTAATDAKKPEAKSPSAKPAAAKKAAPKKSAARKAGAKKAASKKAAAKKSTAAKSAAKPASSASS